MNEKISINNLVRNNSIAIPENLHHIERKYLFEQIISKGEEITNIRYDFTAEFFREKSDMSLLCRINRIPPVFINDKEPDLVVDELAYEAGKVFYPLIVRTDENGKFSNIYNYEKIVDRWLACREKMSGYYVGEEAEKYLLLMDEIIRSKDSVNKIFRRDLFISVFFFPIYKFYAFKRRIESEHYFPLAGKSIPVHFKTEEILSEFLTDNGSFEIIHSGHAIDQRSFLEIEWNYDESNGENPPADINYSARYTLEENTKLIQIVDTQWKFTGEAPYIIEIKISPLGGIPVGRSIIVELEEEPKKEKGLFRDFWDMLRGKNIEQ